MFLSGSPLKGRFLAVLTGRLCGTARKQTGCISLHSHTSAFSFFALCKVNTIPCELNILKSAFPFFWENPVNNGGVRGGRVPQNSAGGRWSVHLQVGIFELVEQVGCASISSGVQSQTVLEMQECECKEPLFGDRTLPAVLLTSTCPWN